MVGGQCPGLLSIIMSTMSKMMMMCNENGLRSVLWSVVPTIIMSKMSTMTKMGVRSENDAGSVSWSVVLPSSCPLGWGVVR